MPRNSSQTFLRDPDSDFHMSPADYGTFAKYDAAIAIELEERDYYIEKNVFWVPALARWKTLQDSAKLPPGTEILGERRRPAGSAGHPAGRSSAPYKITSTGKLIDDALEAVEKENPKLKNVPVASVYDRRTLKSHGTRQPHNSRTNRRRTIHPKISDGRRPTLQLQIDPANLAGLIDLIAILPLQHADLHAKDILGHAPESPRPNSSSALLGDLCAFAVKKSSSSTTTPPQTAMRGCCNSRR